MSKGSVTGGPEGLYTATIYKDDGTPETKAAYCADLTEDLTGLVGMIEIAGDINKGVNVHPGYNGAAVYNAARDGVMYDVPPPPGTQHPSGVFWNWAMRAGWQKWRPNYRYGTIGAINHSTNRCDIELDPCFATDAPDGVQMDINQADVLTDVPIEYMDCDSAAFEVGDEVLIRFENHSWASPTVIGFKSHPKPCAGPWIYFAFGNGYAFIWDALANDYADLRDGNDLPIDQPFNTGDPIWAGLSVSDLVEFLDNSWVNLWSNDTGAGTHTVDEADIEDVYESTIPGDLKTWELINSADLEDTAASPADDMFGGPLEAAYHRYRKIGATADPLYYWDMSVSHFEISWDDQFYEDYCLFYIAASNGSNATFKVATRYLYENYSLRTTVGHTSTDESHLYATYLDSAELKTYRKKSVKQTHMDAGWMDEAWVSELGVISERYVERLQPWVVLKPEIEQIIQCGAVDDLISYFPDHPDYAALKDSTFNTHFLISSDANPIFMVYDHEQKYERLYNSHFFGAFAEDKISSEQLVFGTCVAVEDTADHANSYQGTDGCNWGVDEDECPKCTEAHDAGTMYDLHNTHRVGMGLDPLVPNDVIAGVAATFARAMSDGTAEYSHDGFDGRATSILAGLPCETQAMGENLNRVDAADPDPVATCFQEWLDSPGHRSNIEFPSFTMMGYGSYGEYYVVIFGTAKTECVDPQPGASYYNTAWCCMQMSDEALDKLRIRMGLAPAEDFPWKGVLDELYTPLGTYLGGTGWGPLAAQTLADDKTRDLGQTFKMVGTFYNGDPGEPENKGIINVAMVLPYTNTPKNFVNPALYEANKAQIRTAVFVRAAYDVGKDSDPSQDPTEMDRNTALEAAIKGTFTAAATSRFSPEEYGYSWDMKLCKRK